MSTFSLRVGYSGVFDSSLVGLMSFAEVCGESLGPRATVLSPNVTCQIDPLTALEQGNLEIAIVSLEDVIAHTSRTETTKVRIVGCLLGGDSRALVGLAPTPEKCERQILGAVQPEVALSRWESVSCALDIESADEAAKKIKSFGIIDELLSGRCTVLELNMYWEGLMGVRRGMVRQCARAEEFGVPESFSHLVVVHSEFATRNKTLLRQLRDHLMQAYEAVLNDTVSVAERFAQAGAFPCRPNAGFLKASFRILAPQFESFLKTRGNLKWSDIVPYITWFQRHVAHKRRENSIPFAAVQIENLLCDSWH
jgi:hypothetical protein